MRSTLIQNMSALIDLKLLRKIEMYVRVLGRIFKESTVKNMDIHLSHYRQYNAYAIDDI